MPELLGGYTGKVLLIDLSNRRTYAEPLDDALRIKYIGGRGLGAKLLWDMMPAGSDPRDPNSPLILLTGPLTGLVPGGAQTCFVFKSPHTRITIGHALTGGQWGSQLKFSGYDGLVIHGKADEPVYLLIRDDKVEFRSARRLWGKGAVETEKYMRAEHGPLVSTISIGPAGEKLVKFASVQQEYFRSAARGGTGFLMGSRNLKAIVVRGTGAIPVAETDRFRTAWKDVLARVKEGAKSTWRGYYLRRWGSALSSILHSDVSEQAVRNYREAQWPEIDNIGGLKYELLSRVKQRSCFMCPIGCMQIGVIRSSKYANTWVCPDFDSTGTIGPNLLIRDLAGMLYLNSLGDDLGVDCASMGNVTGFAIECLEKGLLTQKDMDGIPLEWGNVDAIAQFWRKIVNREGIGDLFADGVRDAAAQIGHGSEAFAMHVKGLEFAGYQPNAHHDRGLQYAVGDRGGCHHYGLTVEEQNYRALADSLTSCAWHRPYVDTGTYFELLRYATGLLDGWPDYTLVANRILMLGRAYNLREGMVPMRDDVLPPRVYSEPLTVGPEAGAVYAEDEFRKDRAEWYGDRGCNAEGYPTEERLRALGLDFVVETVKGKREEWELAHPDHE